MLPYVFPEIVPNVLEPKVYRYWLRENDVKGNVRAVVEAQGIRSSIPDFEDIEQPRRLQEITGFGYDLFVATLHP